MAWRRRGKQRMPQSYSADHGASTDEPSNLATVRSTAAGPANAANQEHTNEAEPVIVVYESSERDSKTRLQIVQSGFGSTAAWTALVDAWRGTSASFALLAARAFVPLRQPALAALHAVARVPALSPALWPALRPVPARP